MHKVIIIDDEPLARQLISALLKPHANFNIVAECADGFEGFKAIQENEPDIIFLDVQMPKLNGFEMLELLDTPPSVIFTTAFDEYALKAFEANAIDYLLKPITKERFDAAINKWLLQKPDAQLKQTSLPTNVYEGYQHRIVLKDNGNIRIVPAQDINYLEANDDYVKIVTGERSYLKKSTLSQLEQSFDPKQFVRAHRSYLIPVSKIVRIEPYEKESHIAIMQCGAKIPVSKSGMTRLKSVLGW